MELSGNRCQSAKNWLAHAEKVARKFLGSIEKQRAAEFKMAVLTLRFADRKTEQRFVDEHLTRSMPIIRLSLFFGILLYGLFGVLDIYIMADVLWQVWLIRYGFVCPVLLGVLIFTYTPRFRPAAQLSLSCAMLAAGIGILAMAAVGSAPGSYYYYAGLIVVLIYCLTLIRLRFVFAAAISLALFALYQVVALWINPIPFMVLMNNDFFLGISMAVGVFSSYAQEIYIRYNFVNADLLTEEKLRSDRLLEEARTADRAKTNFLAVMSHELRTPLNAIIGFSEVMQQKIFGALGSERYTTYVDDIHYSGKHLLGIINNILDLSKVESGELLLNEEKLHVCDAVNTCLRMFRDQAAAKGVRLAFEPAASQPWLVADAGLFSQVAINLISNAVKFTEIDGLVTVSVACADGGDCCVRVRDTGIGIAEDDLDRVLEPFVQVEEALSRKHEGTGLGLPLVKKIMELHGGALELESELNEGTTVTARFPSARVIANEVDAPPPALTGS